MNAETYENVMVALHGEAYAHARYLLYAEAARKRGDDRLASLFEGIAAVKLHEHFAELAELVDLVSTDEDNLRRAIQDENAEVQSMYPGFAGQARLVGEAAVAARFEEMAEDEREHEKALETTLERISVPA